MLWLIIKFSLATLGLIWASQFILANLKRLNRYFRVSFFSIGVVFMAVSTTMPELFLGIDSALQGVQELSLGTVLGSNIADIALVFGIVIIAARQIRPSRIITASNGGWVIFSVILPLILLWDRTLSKIDGLILLSVFIAYIYSVFLSKQQLTARLEKIDKKSLLIDMAKFALGIIILLFSAKYVVEYGAGLALSFQIPLLVIGVSVYALSTSLPELVFELRAVARNQKELALGDLAGSLIANSTLVLGLTALIAPITVLNPGNYLTVGSFLLLLVVFLYLSIKKDWRLGRPIGFVLAVSYIIFLLLEVV